MTSNRTPQVTISTGVAVGKPQHEPAQEAIRVPGVAAQAAAIGIYGGPTRAYV